MGGTPYLMYHRIGAPDGRLDRYTVSEASFRAQLNYLHLCNFEVLSVGAALARPTNGRPRVVLTFDDGCDTDLLTAAPLLADHGFGATFYVVPGLFGQPGYLTEDGVRELARMGFEIGSHSLTHKYMSDLDDVELATEVNGSKRRLEDLLARRVRHFACPGGRCTTRVVSAVRAAGYESLATSVVGVNAARCNPFWLRRLDVQHGTSLEAFTRLCRGQGLAERRVREFVLGTAKSVLGNGRYDKVRRALLSF